MRRALGLLVVACVWAAAAFVPTAVSATQPTVLAMVAGGIPYSLFSEAASGTTGHAITITLPFGESGPLLAEYRAVVINGNINAKFGVVDLYAGLGGSGIDDRLTQAWVSSISGTTTTTTATIEFETIAVHCTGTNATCEPAGLPRLSLTSSTNPSDLAQSTTFTASRPRYPGGPSDSGTVAFSSDGTLISGCETVAMSGDQATCTTSFAVGGSHAIVAADSGDTYFLEDSATLTQSVNSTGQVVATVSGSEVAGSTTASFVAAETLPAGITIGGTVACTGLAGGISIDSALGPGAYTIDPLTCSGLSLSGTNASAFLISYAGGTFTVTPASITPIPVTVTGSQDVGSTQPSFIGSASPPSGIAVAGTVTCTGLTGSTPIGPGLAAGSYSIDSATCSGLSLTGAGASSYSLAYLGGTFVVTDRTPPVVTLTSTPTDPSSDTLPGFGFSVSDPDDSTGLAAACSFDGAPFAACTSPATPASALVAGLHTFAVHATDPAGNQSSDAGYIWNVTTRGSRNGSITLSINGNTFAMLSEVFSGTPTNTLTMTATGDEVGHSQFLFNLRQAQLNGTGQPFAADLTVSSGGRTAHLHLVHVRFVQFDISVNPGGTLGAATLGFLFESWSVSFTTDTTAPTVTFTSTPSNPSNDSRPTFGFTIADPDDTTGLQAFCSFDGAPFALCTSPASPLGSLADGPHTFSVYATDPAGNQGPDLSFNWLIDTTPPVITATAVNADGSTYRPNTWTHQDVTVSFVCTDTGGSGVHSLSAPTTLHADGAGQSVSGVCVDAAGNSSSAVFGGIDIDQTPPLLTVGHTVDGTNGWNIHAPVAIAISASDATSGLAGPPVCSDSFGGAPPAALTVTGAGPGFAASVSGDGVHIITCSVADLAGNTTHATDTVLLDVAGPSISVSHTADGNGGWNVHAPVALAITAADSTSGLSGKPSCTDSLNGGSATTLTVSGAGPAFSASATGEGTHAITCVATSVSGTSRSASDTVRIDTVPPVVVYSGNAGTYTVDQTVAITCSATDPPPGSGVASSTCASINGAAYSFGLGSSTFSATATDNAGNVGHGSTTFVVTVTQQGLCNLTLQLVQGSARFKSLPPATQALISKLGGAACLFLLKASHESLDDGSDRDLTAYQAVVNGLALLGFLTKGQAATLVNLSYALD